MSEEESIIKDTLKFTGKFVLAMACGVALASGLYNNIYEPRYVYVQDLNNDNKSDLVVVSKTRRGTVFLQQKDGTYKELYQIQQEQKDSMEASIETIIGN